MASVSSSVRAAEAAAVEKWSIWSIRWGPTGDVTWMSGLLILSGSVLKEIPITKDAGEMLDQLQPGASSSNSLGITDATADVPPSPIPMHPRRWAIFPNLLFGFPADCEVCLLAAMLTKMQLR